MIQPKDHPSTSALYDVGCAGRIRQYRERKSGRIDVMLSGVCRYRIIEEMSTTRGYRLIRPDWSDYAHDYDNEMVESSKRGRFNQILRAYFDRKEMKVDWDVLQELEIEEVVNNLVLILQLTIEEKQLLLESPTVNQRLDVFASLLKSEHDVAAQ
jgi:Lon protease-like protein